MQEHFFSFFHLVDHILAVHHRTSQWNCYLAESTHRMRLVIKAQFPVSPSAHKVRSVVCEQVVGNAQDELSGSLLWASCLHAPEFCLATQQLYRSCSIMITSGNWQWSSREQGQAEHNQSKYNSSYFLFPTCCIQGKPLYGSFREFYRSYRESRLVHPVPAPSKE